MLPLYRISSANVCSLQRKVSPATTENNDEADMLRHKARLDKAKKKESERRKVSEQPPSKDDEGTLLMTEMALNIPSMKSVRSFKTKH